MQGPGPNDFTITYDNDDVPEDEVDRETFFAMIAAAQKDGFGKKLSFVSGQGVRNNVSVGLEELLEEGMRYAPTDDGAGIFVKQHERREHCGARILLWRPKPNVPELIVVKYFKASEHDEWIKFLERKNKKMWQRIEAEPNVQTLSCPHWNIMEGRPNGVASMRAALGGDANVEAMMQNSRAKHNRTVYYINSIE